jgi:hypothetical protein
MLWSSSPTTITFRARRRAAHELELRVVGVLVLVDEDEAEAPAVLLEHLRVGAQDLDRAASAGRRR